MRTRLYRRLQVSFRDVVHRPSGRARLGCNAKWRNTRRASPSRSAAEKGQGFFTGPKPRFGEELVPSSREVTQTKSGVRVRRRSIVPRSVAGGSTERGWSFGSACPGLEIRAGGLVRPSTSEVIIEALRCSPSRGADDQQPLRVVTEPTHAARRDGAEATLVKNEGVRCPAAARTVRRAKESDEKR